MNTNPSASIRDVADADFEREVIEASRQQPVVVDFWAPWCQPCLLLGPLLERLIAERGGEMILAKVNVDEAPKLAERFAIASIPAVKAFRDGRVFREFTGLLPEPYLRSFLDEMLPTPADRLAAQAQTLEASQPSEAERLYREAIAAVRNHETARIGLARVLLAQGKADEIEAVLEPVGVEGAVGEEAQRLKARAYFLRLAGDLGDEAAARQRLAAQPDSALARCELACVLAAKGEYAQALPLLLEAGERDPKLATTKVREAMVQIFYALGTDHPLANEYRGKLTRLLY
jgi:putative thioredoxin